MKSQLVRFLVYFTVLIIGLEILVRANGKYFSALSDKLLLKSIILEREPETKILFLGTSRFLDSIDHHLFSKELEKHTGSKLISLNAATAGLNSDRIAFFSEIARDNKGLTHVIIEASPPSMGNQEKPTLETELLNQPSKKDERLPDRVESELQSFAIENIGLAKYRKALHPKTVIKLLVLYTANVMDPNIWSRKRPLEAILFPKNEKLSEAIRNSLQPEIISKTGELKSPPTRQDYKNLEKISNVFANSGKKVIWIAPPVSKRVRHTSHNPSFTNYYQTLTNKYDTLLYDYAGVTFEERFFRNPTHMSPEGRSLFTKLIAAHLSDQFPQPNQ